MKDMPTVRASSRLSEHGDMTDAQLYGPATCKVRELALNLKDPRQAERWEAAEMFANRVRVALVRDAGAEAHAAVDTGLAAMREIDEPVGDFLAMPLASTPISVRTLAAIEEHLGATTIEELLRCTEAELLAVPNISVNAVAEIHRSLLKASLQQNAALERKLAAAGVSGSS